MMPALSGSLRRRCISLYVDDTTAATADGISIPGRVANTILLGVVIGSPQECLAMVAIRLSILVRSMTESVDSRGAYPATRGMMQACMIVLQEDRFRRCPARRVSFRWMRAVFLLFCEVSSSAPMKLTPRSLYLQTLPSETVTGKVFSPPVFRS